jgi:hypothetical protein
LTDGSELSWLRRAPDPPNGPGTRRNVKIRADGWFTAVRGSAAAVEALSDEIGAEIQRRGAATD